MDLKFYIEQVTTSEMLYSTFLGLAIVGVVLSVALFATRGQGKPPFHSRIQRS